MPAIRDALGSYESSAVDAGLTIPICNNESGDLLISFIMADTGTPTWTNPTGFKTLFSRNNGVATRCAFKISSGAETALTWGSSVNETYNGCVIAIKDIDTKTPFATTVTSSYSESNQDSTAALGNGTITEVAQSFTSTSSLRILAKAKFYLSKTGSPTGNVTCKLYAHTGTLGTSSTPTGAALATSDPIDVSTLTGSLTLIEFIFPDAANWYEMAVSTNYTIALEYSGGDASNYVNVGYDGSAPGHAGNYSQNTGTWAANSGRDLCFYVNQFNFTESTVASPARYNVPTTTTEKDDSIVIIVLTSSVVSTPTYTDGPVHNIIIQDGAAEAHGTGWTYQKTAGTTSSDIYNSAYSATRSTYALIPINPPSTGATIRPTYNVSDTSTFIDFIHGITGYNTNTALAATADTNFGTSLGSFTANDATVAAIADVGVNSYQSMGGLTCSSTADTISGAETVFAVANRPNIGTKNLLCHLRPATPAHTQRWSSIGSGKGAWFGVRSGAATDYKIWQVGGKDHPWSTGAHVPIIINSGASNTVATAGTLDTSSILSLGFWVGGLAGLTCQIGFGMVWLMDKTTIAGGTSIEPINISGIYNAIAKEKFRYSAIQQGKNQILLLQDLQIGDGGSNPVYLELDGTAIEFPSQYNTTTKLVNYNSVDNKIGLIYYAGASDTIIHKNSIISSPSRYFWGLHSSSNTSATYNFEGLSVIGAGTVQLNCAITIDNITINDYSTLDLSNITLTDSTIINVPATSDTATLNASTLLDNCEIDVSLITSGNYWTTASPENFENCLITGGGGHFIRILTPGTYNFVGNILNSFGADGTDEAAIFNDSGGAVTIVVSGGGNSPTYKNGVGATTTISNNTSVTITGLKDDTEVRIYQASTVTQIDGIENATTGTLDDRSFTFSYSAGSNVDIRIFNKFYEPENILNYTIPSSNTSLPVQQRFDRNYYNP